MPGIPAPETVLPSPPETPPIPVAVAVVDPTDGVSGKDATTCSLTCGCWQVVKVRRTGTNYNVL